MASILDFFTVPPPNTAAQPGPTPFQRLQSYDMGAPWLPQITGARPPSGALQQPMPGDMPPGYPAPGPAASVQMRLPQMTAPDAMFGGSPDSDSLPQRLQMGGVAEEMTTPPPKVGPFSFGGANLDMGGAPPSQRPAMPQMPPGLPAPAGPPQPRRAPAQQRQAQPTAMPAPAAAPAGGAQPGGAPGGMTPELLKQVLSGLNQPIQVRNPEAPWRPGGGIVPRQYDDSQIDRGAFMRALGIGLMGSNGSENALNTVGRSIGMGDAASRRSVSNRQSGQRQAWLDGLALEKSQREDWRAGQNASRDEARLELDRRKSVAELQQKMIDAFQRSEDKSLDREQRAQAAKEAADARKEIAKMAADARRDTATMIQEGRNADRDNRAADSKAKRDDQAETTYRTIYSALTQSMAGQPMTQEQHDEIQLRAALAAPGSSAERAAIARAKPMPMTPDGKLDQGRLARGIYKDPQRGTFYWDGARFIPAGEQPQRAGGEMPAPEIAPNASIIPPTARGFAQPFMAP